MPARHIKACLCQPTKALSFHPANVQVLVLMHPSEFGRSSNTVIPFLACASEQLLFNRPFVSSFQDDQQCLVAILKRIPPQNVAVLFPSRTAIGVREFVFGNAENNNNNAATATTQNAPNNNNGDNNDNNNSNKTTSHANSKAMNENINDNNDNDKDNEINIDELQQKFVIVVDGTWSQAKTCLRRLRKLCRDNQLACPQCVCLDLSFQDKSDKSNDTNAQDDDDNNNNNNNADDDNNNDNYHNNTTGKSISVMRTQSQQGRVTTGEALFYMFKELGQSKQELENLRTAYMLRVSAVYHITGGHRDRQAYKDAQEMLKKFDLLE
jgi:hypothetical protein